MGALETATELANFAGRGAGSDAERRAAVWLRREASTGSRVAELEPFWCRPDWALAAVWHAALGLAGSLLAVSHPKLGGALLLAALLSVLADALWSRSPGRLLTFERASQNVVSRAEAGDSRVKLIVTANYDAGRTGLMYQDRIRAVAARARQLAGPAAPGWVAWLALDLAALLAVAIARSGGTQQGAAVDAVQIGATVVLVLALALLVEQGLAEYGPAAGDNASGAATALALVRALDTSPPAHVAVELVLTGAGDGAGAGLQHHLRARRARATDVVVLGIGACGAGRPRWWISDGALQPMRYFGRLRELAAETASAEAYLGAKPQYGRGRGPALAARARALPAIAIGCLDEQGLAPRSHTRADTADRLEDDALGSLLAYALALVDAIDAEVGKRAGNSVQRF
jgi:hypothetical protein